MLEIIKGSNKKPNSSNSLIQYFEKNIDKYDGYLYIGYPIINTSEGPYPVDALLVSKYHDLIVFNLVEDGYFSNYQDLQDVSFNYLNSKLYGYKELTKRKQLAISIGIITYSPTISSNVCSDSSYPLCNDFSLESELNNLKKNEPDEYYEILLSILQSISKISVGLVKRNTKNVASKGSSLKIIEESIANLDKYQSKAILETVDGVQRIRGLAGSGKTIILALKAAYLHAFHPEWKIIVTFNTRSLKDQFKRFITMFHIEYASKEPDWENLKVINAWGSGGSKENEGVYYIFCNSNNLDYYNYTTAERMYGRRSFETICENALNQVSNPTPLYDLILVDEAQDFSPSFLNMCYKMLKEPKRLVYAYDELQSLTSKFLPPPEEIFGKHLDGTPIVIFDKANPSQDIVLNKCYRTPPQILAAAHALGFGIHRKVDNPEELPLIQMFDQKELWKEIGYEVYNGNLESGKPVKLKRTEESTPDYFGKQLNADEILIFKSFLDEEEQCKWIVKDILNNINDGELRPEDIIVINPDPLKTRNATASIRSNLFKEGIRAHIAGENFRDGFKLDESVAFSGVFRAKGNEAAMVYIINSEYCYSSYNLTMLQQVRNMLFTSMTRSKAWVRITGIGNNMNNLIHEYKEVEKNNFSLCFTYPTDDQLKKLKVIHKDTDTTFKMNITDIVDLIGQKIANGEDVSSLLEILKKITGKEIK